MSPLALELEQAPLETSKQDVPAEAPLALVRACALIPTYENPGTVAEVVRAARKWLPVVLVDDGSSAESARVLDSLAREEGVHLVRHAENRGKGVALRSGFTAARELGFTHAISLDADGQHLPEDLPAMLAAAEARPTALILGERDLAGAGAGWGSRIGRVLSNAWLRYVGGPSLADTQTGFRVYPLELVERLDLRGERYELEVEVLAKAAWSGAELASRPIRVRYFSRRERVSHMGVWAMLRVGLAWLRLWRARRVSR